MSAADRLRLLLVRPRDPRPGTRHTRIRTLTLPSVATEFATIASVQVVDEAEQPLPPGPFDLAALTTDTPHAPRAYALADAFRARGWPVLLGGTHVTAMPEEALEHADSVVLGEVEGLAGPIARDLSQGRLQPRYCLPHPPDLSNLPVPDVDVLPDYHRHLRPYPMELTRGCRHACRFCFNRTIHGPGYRKRPIDPLIEAIRGRSEAFLLCMDDNVMNDPEHLAAFAERLIPLRRVWGGQSTLEIAKDPALLRLLQRSGFAFTFVGLESMSEASLRGERKAFNQVARYDEQLARLRRHGIVPFVGLILGLDSDGEDIFSRTFEALSRLNPAACAFTMPVPYPGTEFHNSMEAEGRILCRDLSLYDGRHVIIRPARMSPETLRSGYDRLCTRFYNPLRALSRLPRQVLPAMTMGRRQRLLAYLAISAGYWHFHRRLAAGLI